jgi:acyl-CoA synthetase (AMP-forming)/AMP-acid ligase II
MLPVRLAHCGHAVRLILHTSGTTSHPKIVPLSRRNVCASARNISSRLRLTPQDRGLHVMPLFHIRALIAGVLTPMDAAGSLLASGQENNPSANAEAFVDGRLKEIINRGGEKISPREVDEVLMDHSAVAQVVTFGMPHDKLGEELGAAIVLREGQDLGEQALRQFAATGLADFKVPRKLLFMVEIPKGATGKLQRVGLAAKLGLGG